MVHQSLCHYLWCVLHYLLCVLHNINPKKAISELNHTCINKTHLSSMVAVKFSEICTMSLSDRYLILLHIVHNPRGLTWSGPRLLVPDYLLWFLDNLWFLVRPKNLWNCNLDRLPAILFCSPLKKEKWLLAAVHVKVHTNFIIAKHFERPFRIM